MELLKQENILAGFMTLELRAGKYRGLLIRASGTNNALQTIAAADLGRIQLQHQNFGERINAVFSFFSQRTNLLGGTAEAASAAGGAFAFSAIVSFRRRFDKSNVLVVRNDTKTTLTWGQFNNLAVLVASGTIEVYALYDDNGSARYIPNIRTQQLSAAAAMTIKEHVPYPFVEELWGEDDANIATIQLLRDGLVKVDGTWAARQALSDAENNVETGVTMVELVAPTGESPALVSQTTLQLVTTAALAGNVFTYHSFVCEPIHNG